MGSPLTFFLFDHAFARHYAVQAWWFLVENQWAHKRLPFSVHIDCSHITQQLKPCQQSPWLNFLYSSTVYKSTGISVTALDILLKKYMQRLQKENLDKYTKQSNCIQSNIVSNTTRFLRPWHKHLKSLYYIQKMIETWEVNIMHTYNRTVHWPTITW